MQKTSSGAAGERGFFGGLRVRYLGPRPLIEDDSVRSGVNLLDRKDSEIDYFYESRLAGETAGVEDIHFHPADPISFRVALTGRF